MKTVNPRQIIELHEVRDRPLDYDKLQGLVNSMQTEGWTGRPLLTFFNGEVDYAWTGSHRITAARIVDVDVPVLRIDEGLVDDWLIDNDKSIEDLLEGDFYKRLSVLEQIGDLDAIELMHQEDDWR